MSFRIEVKGLDDVLDVLGSFCDGEKLHRALELSAEEVRKEAAARAPVAEENGGDLRDSITSSVEGNRATVGTNSDHAIFNEYGTGIKGDPKVAHTTKESWVAPPPFGYKTIYGMEARPFMVPALKNNKDKIKRIFREVYSGD